MGDSTPTSTSLMRLIMWLVALAVLVWAAVTMWPTITMFLNYYVRF